MTAPHLSTDDAARLLAEHLGRPVDGPVSLVGEGQWSQAFGFTLDRESLVVRFGWHVADFEKDRRVSAFARAGLPVPAVRSLGRVDAFGAGGSDRGLWATVATRGFGEPLESLDAAAWVDVLPSLLALLDAARSVDLSAATGRGAWQDDLVGSHATWATYLRAVADDPPTHRTNGWRARLAGFPEAQVVFDAGLARLDEVADAGGSVVGPHLIHADLLNRNVLVGPQGISAVFDWGNALVGDHLYDLAVLLFWSAWYPALDAVDIGARFAEHHRAIGLDVMDREARLLACQLHVGLEHLAYSAFLDDPSLGWITARTAALL